MSIRTWQAPASAQIELADGVYPVVTQEDLMKAVLDGVVTLDRLGGVLGVVLQRVPTGTPNEMVTTRALVTWQDRTNAKPQPEQDARPPEPVEPLPEEVYGRLPDDEAPLDDGLRVPADAVDESDVPKALRA